MDLKEAFEAGLHVLSPPTQHAADTQHQAFLARFPRSAWPSLALEQYALGTNETKTSYSYALEWGTPVLGSIRGGSSLKHVIFQRRKTAEWRFPSSYSSVEEAWTALRRGFAEAFEKVDADDIGSIDTVAALRPAKVVKLKSLYLYFPDAFLPVYSQQHLIHFARALGVQADVELVALNRTVLKALQERAPATAQTSRGLAELLYKWAPQPGFDTPSYVKIAPGEQAAKWQECLHGGYICVGWDNVGDLSLFESEDEFRAAFASAYPYNENKSTSTRKAKELWRLTSLQPGDRVMANRGISQVVAIGTVKEPSYEWRPERDEYKHTVAVDWDTSKAKTLDPPVAAWATTTVQELRKKVIAQVLGIEGPEGITEVDPQEEKRFLAWASALQRKKQLIFYGPPGTGKTYNARAFARWWLRTQLPPGNAASSQQLDTLLTTVTPEGKGNIESLDDAAQLTQVTFHPSYAYEEFVEGFRPVATEDGASGLTLALRDGVFKRVCRSAKARPNAPYVLFIDEINRANVPRVFGELLTLLEADKRDMSLLLPTSGQPFTVPDNVFVIGTMNTADRSIRTLDAALRRRFAFIEIMPEPGLLAGAVINDLALDTFLTELNRRLIKSAGRERQIGHSLFMEGDQPIQGPATLGQIMRLEVIPLIQEIAYDDYGRLAEYLGQEMVNVDEQSLTSLVKDDDDLIAALVKEYKASSDTATQ